MKKYLIKMWSWVANLFSKPFLGYQESSLLSRCFAMETYYDQSSTDLMDAYVMWKKDMVYMGSAIAILDGFAKMFEVYKNRELRYQAMDRFLVSFDNHTSIFGSIPKKHKKVLMSVLDSKSKTEVISAFIKVRNLMLKELD